MEYLATHLQNLAKTSPQEIINIINKNNSDIKTITEAIEILGEEKVEEALILPVLKRLLRHIHAQVRESTILAISSYYQKELPKEILDRIKIMVKADPSPIVRNCCEDVLENFS